MAAATCPIPRPIPGTILTAKAHVRISVQSLDWALMEPDLADDAELLGAHVAGDPQAFARLYDRYDRPCFQFIRRLLGSAHGDAAEDLHQETWMAVSKSASAFDPARATFGAWLFTIARHKVLDHFRRQKVVLLASAQDDAADLVPDPGPTPLQQVESRELAQRVVTAVEALPLEQRGAFVMFAQAGLSLEEIAQATGVAVETAKSRLRYARARLRQALAGERSAHV
jgi:RNA polymerase sigma factor (sigma-70 family)